MPDQVNFPWQRPHLMTLEDGSSRGCRCSLGDDHPAEGTKERLAALYAADQIGVNPIRVAELRPRGTGKAAEQEAWRHQERLTDAFVSTALRVHAEHQEQIARETIQAALKLVDENPRNEPMRTPVPRAAVERMLAKDLERTGLGAGELEDLAHELFDAGWRPTIDRLVR